MEVKWELTVTLIFVFLIAVRLSLPVIVFSINCFHSHCSSFHGIIYPIFFLLFCRNSLYFIDIVHSPLIYYANVFPNVFLNFDVVYNIFGMPKNYTMYIVTYIYLFLYIFWVARLCKGFLEYSVPTYYLFFFPSINQTKLDSKYASLTLIISNISYREI